MRTGRKDMTKLTVAFRTFMNALKKMNNEFAQKSCNFTKKFVYFEDAQSVYIRKM
jgi:hypothetical protein